MEKALPNIHIPKPFKNGSTKDRNNPLLQKEKHPKQAVLTNIQAGAGTTYARTSHGNIRFDNGAAVLPDDGRADDIAGEIKETYGRHPHHFRLTKGREGMQIDTVHNYKFGSHPAMPWARYDEFGRRLPDKETKSGQVVEAKEKPEVAVGASRRDR